MKDERVTIKASLENTKRLKKLQAKLVKTKFVPAFLNAIGNHAVAIGLDEMEKRHK